VRVFLLFLLIIEHRAIFLSLPELPSQSRNVSSIHRNFNIGETDEQYKERLVLNFFLSRIGFEANARVEDIVEKSIKNKTIHPATIDRLSRPKEYEEKLLLPILVTKKLTEQQKSDLFDRLSQPKIISSQYNKSADSSKKTKKIKKIKN